MRHSLLLATGWLLCCCGSLSAIDLAKIERSAPKLPGLKSGAAQYCLLVFGPEAKERVWLVHDGDWLYVDRNGNGDLTEPGESVSVDSPDGRRGIYEFRVGEISTAAGVHKDLRVRWQSVEHMRDRNAEIKARLAREPDFRGCLIMLDVAMSGFHGSGIDGRVPCSAGADDLIGLLQFAPRPEEAPIVHFGGPWQISLYSKHLWHVGREETAMLSISTPGLGPGTTVYIGYENVVPNDLKPLAEIVWPAAVGSARRHDRFELGHRCCIVNLYGEVQVPADIPPGVANVEVSLPHWPGATVAGTEHQVPVLPPLPRPKRQPVSSRLTRRLQHEHQDGNTVAIQFSPDGRRLIAGDNPGGLVHVWDLASGQRLVSIQTDKGLRSTFEHFVVTPDWKKLVAPTNDGGKWERIERDGKALHRVCYNGSIQVWDLESGRLTDTLKTDPARSSRYVTSCPGSRRLLAVEDTPGEFEWSQPGALSLWDLETGKSRELFARHAYPEAFSADGKRAAVSVSAREARGGDAPGESIVFYDTSSWEPTGTPIQLGPLARCSQGQFLDGRSKFIASVATNPTEDDDGPTRHELKLWSLPEATETWSLALKKGESAHGIMPVPGRQALLVATSHGMLKIDLNAHPPEVVSDERLRGRMDPSGKWTVRVVEEFPAELGSDASPDELPQPHLEIRDVASGALLEDLVAPPADLNSLVFSPDGHTLATSGEGSVLLWDFSDPPGKAAPAVVGQPFAAAGTLVDGKPLDWSAYRGKVVLVTYWATWCQPCVAEIPEIKKLYDALHGRGFEVLGVSVDKDRDVLERFLDSERVPWQVVRAAEGQEGKFDHPLARHYGVDTIPKTFLIDRQGNIAAIDVRGTKLEALADELLDRVATEKPK